MRFLKHRHSVKAVVPTLLASAALILSIAAFVMSLEWTQEEFVQTTAGDRIEELEREIAHLKGTVYEGKLEKDDAPTSNLVQTEVASLAASYQEKINHTVESMRWTMTVRGLMPPTQEHIEKANLQIFDNEVSVKRKLVALRILKTCDKITDEVTKKMLEAYYQTSDFNMQAEIFDQLDGMDTPELASALLEASSTSPNARVRKEAVDALSGFLPNPELFVWLKQVASSDSDKDVKREAERLLVKYQANVTN